MTASRRHSVEPEGAAAGPSVGTDRKVLIQLMGLQRSGNHAVANWICSLFRRPVHLNNVAHDFFRQPQAAGELTKADCMIVSFEDARGKLRKGLSMVESVELLDPAQFPGVDCHVLRILRDPYNCWASRVRARETSKLSSSPALQDFIRDWTELARLYTDGAPSFILYNSWFHDRSYARTICARLGGTYSERTRSEVLGEGGGSSFDGFVRPSYRTIFGKLDYYMGRGFRRRFLKAPGSYITRLFSPPIDGTKLQVDSRWKHVVGHEGSRPLFENAEIAALSRKIFGFYIDGSGELRRTAPPARGKEPSD
jgi:hypothetical protein